MNLSSPSLLFLSVNRRNESPFCQVRAESSIRNSAHSSYSLQKNRRFLTSTTNCVTASKPQQTISYRSMSVPAGKTDSKSFFVRASTLSSSKQSRFIVNRTEEKSTFSEQIMLSVIMTNGNVPACWR